MLDCIKWTVPEKVNINQPGSKKAKLVVELYWKLSNGKLKWLFYLTLALDCL
jgi:hypothetical protein